MSKILPQISNKEKEIIKLIYQFRFLNRIQIQNFLNHKHHSQTNIWLKDLNQKQYINRKKDLEHLNCRYHST